MITIEAEVMRFLYRNGEVFDGDVLVSMQSKWSNSSVVIQLRRPKCKVSSVGIELIDGKNEACISSLDIVNAEVTDVGKNKSCHIEYGKSGVMISAVFIAA